jgi:hypothetical protein
VLDWRGLDWTGVDLLERKNKDQVKIIPERKSSKEVEIRLEVPTSSTKRPKKSNPREKSLNLHCSSDAEDVCIRTDKLVIIEAGFEERATRIVKENVEVWERILMGEPVEFEHVCGMFGEIKGKAARERVVAWLDRMGICFQKARESKVKDV